MRWVPLRAYVLALVALFAVAAAAAFIFEQNETITLIGMGVLLAGTLLTYRLVMGPLMHLSEAMGRGKGALEPGIITPSGPAEIARLAYRFNALAAEVRSEIAERTRAESNYRLLFAGNPQPLFVYDLDSLSFLEVNEAMVRRYGYSRDELLAMTVGVILGPEESKISESMTTLPDLHHSGPWRQLAKDGSVLDVAMTSIRLPYDGRNARMVVVEDLTERTHLESQLHQSQRLESVGQLAGGIAHDFNNLLAVILNYAEFVAEKLPEGDLRHDVEEIQRAASRAADLTRQLLIFARREAARPQVLDLNAVVTGVENLLRRAVGERVNLVLSLARDLPAVRADPGQMEQVLLNLAVNARDAMPGGGDLTVETCAVEIDASDAGSGVPPGGYVRLSVRDTGSGMTAEVKAHAFEPFFTTKPTGQGTGLGLATAFGIVTAAAGTISIDSAPDTGTIVSLHLPAVDEPAEPTTRPAQVDQARTGEGHTILIVEDESAVLQAAVRILTTHGYKVLSRSDPTHALGVLEDAATNLSILVTDVVMPRLSGVDLARRAQEVRPGLPVLFLSGYSQDTTTGLDSLPPGSAVLPKPFTRRLLLDAIAELLMTAPQ